MSKSNNKKSNVGRYAIIGILVLGMIGYIFTSLPNSSSPRENITVVTDSTPKNPKFKKEASIVIRKMSGEEVTRLDVEIAETDEERAQGLMYRQSMEGNHGMWFIFEEEKPQSFWMKNTYIPLDIMFVNKDMRIVDQYLGAEPKSKKSIRSRRPATYVLEVNEGFCRAYNIGPGMTIDFERH